MTDTSRVAIPRSGSDHVKLQHRLPSLVMCSKRQVVVAAGAIKIVNVFHFNGLEKGIGLADLRLFSLVLAVGLVPHVLANVLAGLIHRLKLLIHHLVVVVSLLLALIDEPELWTKLLNSLDQSLSKVVYRLPNELTVDHLLLIEPAPLRVILPSPLLLLVAGVLLATGPEEGRAVVLLDTRLLLLG